MRDLRFYDVPLRKPGTAGFFVSLGRRAARKLMLPFFDRQIEILNSLCERLDQNDHLPSEIARTDAKAEAINRDFDGLNAKFELLSAKFGALNAKMDDVMAKFDALKRREDELRDEFAAVIALNWDHVAIGRRLAQLEDRLLTTADPNSRAEPGLDRPILFPGLERFERRTG